MPFGSAISISSPSYSGPRGFRFGPQTDVAAGWWAGNGATGPINVPVSAPLPEQNLEPAGLDGPLCLPETLGANTQLPTADSMLPANRRGHRAMRQARQNNLSPLSGHQYHRAPRVSARTSTPLNLSPIGHNLSVIHDSKSDIHPKSQRARVTALT
jgi:hypothetical protein